MKRTSWLRLGLWIGVTALGLAAVAILALALLGPALTRDRIEVALTHALARPVRVGAVRFEPWLLRVSLADVVLLGEPAGTPVGRLRIPRADVSLSIASAWRRQVVLSVRVHGLDLAVEIGPPSAERVSPFPLPETFDLGPFEARLGSARATDARIEVTDPRRGLRFEATGADVTAWPARGDLDVRLEVARFGVGVGAVREEATRVSADGRLAADRVDVRRLAWRWLDRPMGVDGRVRDPWGDAPELELRASGELPIAAVTRWATADAGIDGVAKVDVRVDGPVTALRAAGRVSAAPLTVAGTALDTVTADARWAAGALHLDGVHAAVGTGRLSARAAVVPLDGDATRIAVEILDLVLPAPLGGLRSGRGAVDARLAHGAIHLTRARVDWPAAAVALDGRTDAHGALSGQLSLTADLAALDPSPAFRPIAGRLDLKSQVAGTLSAPELAGRVDLGALVVSGRAVDPVAARFRLSSRAADRAPRRWDLAVDAPRIAVAALALEDVGAALTLGPARVEIADAHARISGAPLRLTGAWGWDGAGRGRASLEPVALDRVAAVPPALALAGSARGEADVAVSGGQASVTGAVHLEHLVARGFGLGQGRLDVRLRGTALAAELTLPGRKARVEARGQLASGGAVDARLEVSDLGLKELLAESSPGAAGLVEGRVSARGELSVPLDRPDAATGAIRVEPAGLVLLGDPWTSPGPIALRWQRGSLALEALRLEGPAGALTASGTLAGAAPLQMALALDNSRLPGPLAPFGRGTARAELRGSGAEFELVRLDGRWPGLSLAATARADESGLGALRAQLSADLTPLARAGTAPVSGAVTATIEAHGPWSALQGTGRVRAAALEIAGAQTADIDVPLRLDRRTVRVETARARLGASRVEVSATATLPDGAPVSAEALARDLRFTAQARGAPLRLEDLDALLPVAARGRGELTLAARAEGTGRAWRGTATVAGSRAEVAGTALRQVSAVAAFDGSHIEVTELRAEAQDLPLRASGAWSWAGGGRASATIGPGRLAGVGPPGLALAGTGRASAELTARPTPALVVEGTVQAALEGFAVAGVALGAGRVDASIRAGALRATVAFPDRQLAATATGSLAAGGALQVTRAEITAREGTLTASGAIGPTALDLRAQGRLPLDVLPTLRPEIRDAGGVLELSLRATGTPAAPSLSGDGALRGGRLLFRDRPETLRDIEARFTVSPQGVQLRDASAVMGGGRIQARGDLALEGRAPGPYRITASARNVSLATIDGLSSAWDADLELSGRGGEAWLQGGARLVRGVYTRDLSLLSLALSRPRPEAAADEGRLHLLVRVRLDDNLAVRTRIADLRAGGALTVQGTTGAPVVFGAIESHDGRIVFRGHDFAVTSASVRFADPRAVDPFLDVIATSRIRDYEVTVQLGGRLSDLSVRLSSVPRLPPDDLLALVSVGATKAELKDSPATVLLGETGKELAKSLLGIDPMAAGLRMSIVSSDDGQGDPYKVWEDERDRPSATRRAGDRREKVRLEYRLLEPVYLSGEYDPEGGYGADIIFRLRFR